jgi:anthranilate/para-aminobenzoate synthase component I
MPTTAATLDSNSLSAKKKEGATSRTHKKVKATSTFDREAFDKDLDESLEDLKAGRVYKVNMNNPEKSIQKIIRQAK